MNDFFFFKNAGFVHVIQSEKKLKKKEIERHIFIIQNFKM